MLKYLLIQLDDTSISFCHYENKMKTKNLIPLDKLKKAILFAMKENLIVQFIYPAYELPEDYKNIIENIDHAKISTINGDEIVVFNKLDSISPEIIQLNSAYIWRTNKTNFFLNYKKLEGYFNINIRLNITLIDIDSFTDNDFIKYENALLELSNSISLAYKKNLTPQLNILTDRTILDKMNNCNAGYESITLSPNGNFYICPAFYLSGEDSVGNLDCGLKIKNAQLYKINNAPLCRDCDAYQCRRCVFLNKKTTLEVNTPSHEQCVISHIERNTSKILLNKIREFKNYSPNIEIPEISYLDPFDVKK